ncbi:OvmZ protein [Streptomyces sp. NPDC047081]|uniref:OvmZ protein n=1 Tax=Streptomyces sp. NPDC047081 TaxID=3154706 RepID=UPI0033D47009
MGPKQKTRCPLGESLRAKLRDIEEIYRESEDELATPSGWSLERVSGTRSVGIRLDDKVISLRSEISDLLSSWAGLVMAERRSAAAHCEGVSELLRFLHSQIQWLAAHPAGSDLDAELSTLLESSRSILGPRVHRVSLGVCCHPGCGAPLHARLSSAGDAVSSQVACEIGHTVPPEQWLLLSGRLRLTLSGRPGARGE